MMKLFDNIHGFLLMKYEQWLMRRVDKDLKWYLETLIDDATTKLQEKIWELKEKTWELEEMSWELEEENSQLEDALFYKDEEIRALEEKLEFYEPTSKWQEEESVEESWNNLYNLIEEMLWDSLERSLEL